MNDDQTNGKKEKEKFIEEKYLQDQVKKREEGKHNTLHYIFIAGVVGAFAIYSLFAIVWFLHRVLPMGWRWLKPDEVASLEDLVLFILISLLVGELRSRAKNRK